MRIRGDPEMVIILLCVFLLNTKNGKKIKLSMYLRSLTTSMYSLVDNKEETMTIFHNILIF
jgi:hypothetical protein